MDKETQEGFYSSIKKIRDCKSLKLFVDDVIEISKTDTHTSRDTEESLPLNVWVQRGFDPEVILKCPTTQHPFLGTCYSLNLNKKLTDESEEHKRKQIINVTDRPTCPPMPKQVSSVVGASREITQQAKAEAVEKERMRKQAAQVVNKITSKIAKALFNTITLSSGKVSKNLPDAHQIQGTQLKSELQKMEKALKQAILGTSVDVSAQACEALIAFADSWHKRSTGLLQAAAMKL